MVRVVVPIDQVVDWNSLALALYQAIGVPGLFNPSPDGLADVLYTPGSSTGMRVEVGPSDVLCLVLQGDIDALKRRCDDDLRLFHEIVAAVNGGRLDREDEPQLMVAYDARMQTRSVA